MGRLLLVIVAFLFLSLSPDLGRGRTTSVTFIEEPEDVLKTQADNHTSILVWKIQYNSCIAPGITIKTKNFTLYPDPEDSNVPTMLKRDYNVAVQESTIFECQNNDNMLGINVSLRITSNTKVFTYVPYVVCIIDIDDYSNRSKNVCLRSGYQDCPSTSAKTTTPATKETPSTTVKELDITNCSISSNAPISAAHRPKSILLLCAFFFIITKSLI